MRDNDTNGNNGNKAKAICDDFNLTDSSLVILYFHSIAFQIPVQAPFTRQCVRSVKSYKSTHALLLRKDGLKNSQCFHRGGGAGKYLSMYYVKRRGTISATFLLCIFTSYLVYQWLYTIINFNASSTRKERIKQTYRQRMQLIHNGAIEPHIVSSLQICFITSGYLLIKDETILSCSPSATLSIIIRYATPAIGLQAVRSIQSWHASKLPVQ